MIIDKSIIYKDNDYISIVQDLINNEMVKKMKLYRQHFNVSCFDHCLYVSYNLYLLCRKYNLDYVSAARAGMVHDLFLYDWRYKQDGRKGLHAFSHPKTAYENAQLIMNINEKEKDIILKHMWPVTFNFPKYKETFLITLVDKYIAIKERKIGKENKYEKNDKVNNV